MNDLPERSLDLMNPPLGMETIMKLWDFVPFLPCPACEGHGTIVKDDGPSEVYPGLYIRTFSVEECEDCLGSGAWFAICWQ
jgi:hypothetical protein